MKKRFLIILSALVFACTGCELIETISGTNKGSSSDDDGGYITCTWCKGSGDCHACGGDGLWLGNGKKCDYCDGSGVCEHCHGSGELEY
mgnify:CR=1 FL=1